MPEVEARDITIGTARLTLRIPEDLAWFDGHFEGMPVVPGVVQIHWATRFATEVFGSAAFTGTLRRIKFRRLLLPGAVVILDLVHDAAAGEIGFSLHSRSGGSGPSAEHASGRLVLATQADVD